ncbi:hypothetical protein BpHYR1_026969 [Brachionus plicatilis]|uniref:Uncharacterized protein n=1 Tax=Brachionus plicatilis TaxID=10195 RepID=A0A3M7SQV6_BRAPC|nr:hypothetical protein BpHYR1_026969 [Brachionus plicatilis]
MLNLAFQILNYDNGRIGLKNKVISNEARTYILVLARGSANSSPYHSRPNIGLARIEARIIVNQNLLHQLHLFPQHQYTHLLIGFGSYVQVYFVKLKNSILKIFLVKIFLILQIQVDLNEIMLNGNDYIFSSDRFFDMSI